ncbi:MAG: hypothetical protein E7292_01975 [Lachnospiraceae bacterium]|nr:hypothetical protein [Lachnospiraceae bacterium]
MKNKIPVLLRALTGFIPLWLNNVASLRFFVYLDRNLIDELGLSGYLVQNGVREYQYGIGWPAQIGTFVIMLVTVIWILITSRFLFKDKKHKRIYKVVSLGITLIMYIFWVWYYLDYYPLFNDIRIWY